MEVAKRQARPAMGAAEIAALCGAPVIEDGNPLFHPDEIPLQNAFNAVLLAVIALMNPALVSIPRQETLKRLVTAVTQLRVEHSNGMSKENQPPFWTNWELEEAKGLVPRVTVISGVHEIAWYPSSIMQVAGQSIRRHQPVIEQAFLKKALQEQLTVQVRCVPPIPILAAVLQALKAMQDKQEAEGRRRVLAGIRKKKQDPAPPPAEATSTTTSGASSAEEAPAGATSGEITLEALQRKQAEIDALLAHITAPGEGKSIAEEE